MTLYQGGEVTQEVIQQRSRNTLQLPQKGVYDMEDADGLHEQKALDATSVRVVG
jgi:flagella basal body P-ring formation protein FlgA